MSLSNGWSSDGGDEYGISTTGLSIDDRIKQAELDKLNFNKEWDPWLKGGSLAIGGLNLAMNLGMYGPNKDKAKAETSYYNAKTADALEETKQRRDKIASLSRGMA